MVPKLSAAQIRRLEAHAFHVGHYAIERISADGTVKAGCHTIPARVLGVEPGEVRIERLQ